jgi:hypothetical protein
MLPAEIIIDQLLAVFREGCEGPKNPWSYFTDSGPSAGLLGSLANVTADEASKATCGSSIAAHVHHVIFAFNASAAWIRGDHSPRDWEESWSKKAVTDEEWAKMKADLQLTSDSLRQAITFHTEDSAHAFGGAVGAVAHLAYHLGAIKQKISAIRHT